MVKDYDHHIDNSSQSAGTQLTAIGISHHVENGRVRRTILHDVDLVARAGEFVAILGKSGAGKSTLVDVLNGRLSGEGQVFWDGALRNGHHPPPASLGYIPQHDILHRVLPVERALFYAARLRLPPSTSDRYIQTRIEEVLAHFDLDRPPELKYQPVSALSNGERKRVTIAAEAISRPGLFFLDEPTSGLDPLLEKKIMRSLRRMADDGQTVMLVTHATASLDLVDRVIILSQGHQVYNGPPADAPAFFGVETIADIYEVIDQKGAEWSRWFRAPWMGQGTAPPPDTLAPPIAPENQSPDNIDLPQIKAETVSGSQFRILCQRTFETVYRDWMVLLILLLLMPLMGLALAWLADEEALVGRTVRPAGEIYVAWKDAQTAIFMMALAALLPGLFGASYELVKERLIFRHEAMMGLRTSAYVAAKLAVLAGLAMVQCLLFILVLAPGMEMPEYGVMLPGAMELYITLVLTALAAITLGLLISALSRSVNVATYILTGTLFAQIIFSGAIFEMEGPTGVLSYLMISRWALDGLGTTIDMERLGINTQLCTADGCSLVPTPVSEMGLAYGNSAEHLMLVWGVLLGFSLLFGGMSWWWVRRTVAP